MQERNKGILISLSITRFKEQNKRNRWNIIRNTKNDAKTFPSFRFIQINDNFMRHFKSDPKQDQSFPILFVIYFPWHDVTFNTVTK